MDDEISQDQEPAFMLDCTICGHKFMDPDIIGPGAREMACPACGCAWDNVQPIPLELEGALFWDIVKHNYSRQDINIKKHLADKSMQPPT